MTTINNYAEYHFLASRVTQRPAGLLSFR